MKVRLGIIDGELQMDMCQGEEGSQSLVSEASYGADGSVYTINAVRIGNWGGHEESSSFDMTVDLGTDGTVTDGVVDLGTTGNASATGHMDGGFGAGVMSFSADASDNSNTVNGGFQGEFTDPFSGGSSSFTGRVHAKFGGSSNTGTAKFSFTGTMPPMRVSDMIPFNIPVDQQDSFLSSFGAELGLTLTTDSLLCPNPDFNPGNPDNTVKPMVEADDDGNCPEVTHTGTESFSITNGTSEGDFGESVTQVFTIIADSGSEFFDGVSAFDIATIDPTAGTIAFSRNWDCGGAGTPLAFDNFTPAQFQAIETEMQKCFALEEKARANDGMGGYNCHQEEQQNGVNDFAEQGGPEFGLYGGDLSRNNSLGNSTCPAAYPDHLFINATDPDANGYCFPLEGICTEFTVASNAANNLSISIGSGISITSLAFTQTGTSPATSVVITFGGGQFGTCTAPYSITQPSFDAPPEFGGEGDGPEGGIPQACLDTFGTDVTEQECHSLCSQKGTDCSQ